MSGFAAFVLATAVALAAVLVIVYLALSGGPLVPP